MTVYRKKKLPMQVAIAVVVLMIVSNASLQAQSTEKDSSEVWRDIGLTVPAAAKAGIGIWLLSGIFSFQPELATTTDIIAGAAGLTLGAILATTNITLIANAWSDRPDATRLWRRINLWVEATWLVAGVGVLIAEYVVHRDFTGLILQTMLPFAAAVGASIFLDTIPFSTEKRT